MKPDIYKQNKKFICDWVDKTNYLIQYVMLKFYATHGMTVDNVHEIIPQRQRMCFGKHIIFITQNRNLAKMILKKTSIKYSIKQFVAKQWKMIKIE